MFTAVSVHVYMLAVTAGSATLAGWICLRLPRLVPASTAGAAAWVAVALGCGIAGRPLVEVTTESLGPVAAAMLVVLPGGVCVFLAVGFATLTLARELELTD
jgi:hypothetical protein